MSDRAAIRDILNRDRIWSIYALGDLQPGFFERCTWTVNGSSLAMLYRAFEVPVLFSIGPTGQWLVDAVRDEPRLYLHLLPDAAAVLECEYQVTRRTMWRMALDRAAWNPAPFNGVERLSIDDAEAIERLYRDGDAAGEAPDFYDRSMIANGVFFGIRLDKQELAAVAGTHLVSETEGVVGIGSVYTRRDSRGRGFGAGTTTAVVNELIARGIDTIALNVAVKNTAARRVYERLGFIKHCEYYEGMAWK